MDRPAAGFCLPGSGFFLCRFFSDFYSICGGHPGLDWVSWVGLPRGQARPARYCLPGAQESSKFSARNLSLHLCMSTPSGTHPQPLHVHIYTDTRLDPGNDRQLSRVQQPLKFGQNLNCSPRKASFAGKILNSTYKVLKLLCWPWPAEGAGCLAFPLPLCRAVCIFHESLARCNLEASSRL